MDIIGKIVLYLVMFCCIIGAISSIVREDSELGKSFDEGLHTIGPLFLPFVGLMASVPYLTIFVQKAFGALYDKIGADPAIAATTFIPSDVGGYLLAHQIAHTPETWIMAMAVGVMAAPIISFNIPVALAILEKEDYPYLALGAMSGIITIPFGVFISCIILFFAKTPIRTVFSTSGDPTYELSFYLSSIFINLVPLSIVCLILVLGLKYFPDKMIKGFMWYGKLLTSALKIVVALAITEYYTNFFSKYLGCWGFNPIIADDTEKFRAIEVVGAIGMMLAGAFPMLYLIQKYMQKPLTKFGRLVGLTAVGSTGLFAALANAVAMFNIVKDMPAGDKVMCISFSVCAGYILGDFIAFTTNFQPTVMFPLLLGKLSGGIIGIFIAKKISVPKAIEIEQAKSSIGTAFPPI